MRKLFKKIKLSGFIAASAIALPLVGASSLAVAAEWEENTPYYEDDAWYDVSEWLDGNDYNPTDEVFGVWDDETYDSNVADTDEDDDLNAAVRAHEDHGFYYDDNADDDFFYDYYDDNYAYYDPGTPGAYDYSSSYYDFDDDGLYDAYSYRIDTDGDGIYDDYEYYSFNDADQSEGSEEAKQTQAAEKSQSGRELQFAGTIEKLKQVKVRGKARTIAHVKSENGQSLAVDLGQMKLSAGEAQHAQPEGKKIQVAGPLVTVGEKQLLIAQRAKVGDQDVQKVERKGRQLTGTIKNTRDAKIRGQQRTLAVLKLKDKDDQVLVDLGPSDGKIADLKEGDELKVEGVPVKTKDRMMIIAKSVSMNGESMDVERQHVARAQSATSQR